MLLACLLGVSLHCYAPPCIDRWDSAVLASFLLKEELGHIGRIGCTLCILGSLIIVLHAPEDKEVQTVDEVLHFALQPGQRITATLAPPCQVSDHDR